MNARISQNISILAMGCEYFSREIIAISFATNLCLWHMTNLSEMVIICEKARTELLSGKCV